MIEREIFLSDVFAAFAVVMSPHDDVSLKRQSLSLIHVPHRKAVRAIILITKPGSFLGTAQIYFVNTSPIQIVRRTIHPHFKYLRHGWKLRCPKIFIVRLFIELQICTVFLYYCTLICCISPALSISWRMNSLHMTVILKGEIPMSFFFFSVQFSNYSQHSLQGKCEKSMEIKCILGLPRRLSKRKIHFSKNEVFLINCE